MSTRGANVGELSALETSVGGVEEREIWELDEILGEVSDMFKVTGFIDLTAENMSGINGGHEGQLKDAAYKRDLRHSSHKNELLESFHLVNALRAQCIREYGRTGRLKPEFDMDQ